MKTNNQNNDNIFGSPGPHLSLEEMKGYLQERLNPEAVRKVEWHISSCPFCSDALEGLEQENDWPAFESSLARLKSRIKSLSRSKPARVITLRNRYLALAASVMVLLSISFLVYLKLNQQYSERVFSKHFEKFVDTFKHPGQTLGIAGEKSAADFAETKGSDNQNQLAAESPVASENTPAPQIPPVEELRIVESAPRNAVTEDLADQETVEEEQIMTSAPAAGNATIWPDTLVESIPPEFNGKTFEFTEPAGNYAENDKTLRGRTAKTVPAIDLEDSGETSLMETGIKYYNADHFDVALGYFQEILHREPDNDQALLYTGICYLLLDKSRKALRYFDQILKMAGSDYAYQAQWYKALGLLKMNRKKTAIELLETIANSPSPYAREAEKTLEDL